MTSFPRRSLGLLGAALLLGCAGSSGERTVPRCEPVAALPPRAAPACYEGDPGLRELARRIDALGSGLVVRLSFDATARPAELCADALGHEADWTGRRQVRRAARLEELGPVPACLASRRIDLGRRSAYLSALARARRGCSMLRLSGGSPAGGLAPGELDCIAKQLDVLLLPLPDGGALLFGPAEVPDPPALDAVSTLERCAGEGEPAADRIACVTSDGWELLTGAEDLGRQAAGGPLPGVPVAGSEVEQTVILDDVTLHPAEAPDGGVDAAAATRVRDRLELTPDAPAGARNALACAARGGLPTSCEGEIVATDDGIAVAGKGCIRCTREGAATP